jgi:hypothetical protein
MPREQLDHQAFVLRVEVRNEHERNTAVGRHRRKEPFEGIQSACRRDETCHRRTDGKTCVVIRLFMLGSRRSERISAG